MTFEIKSPEPDRSGFGTIKRSHNNVLSDQSTLYFFEIPISFSRYQVLDFPGGSLLRIEPVRRKPDRSEIECRAENGAGDPVFAQASLTVFDGEFFSFFRKKFVVLGFHDMYSMMSLEIYSLELD